MTINDFDDTGSRERFMPIPGLIETDLGNEMVLLDPATQQMFSLNATGRTLWRSLRGHTLEEAAQRVAAEFDVGTDQATADAQALLHDLLDAGLLQSTPE